MENKVSGRSVHLDDPYPACECINLANLRVDKKRFRHHHSQFDHSISILSDAFFQV